ncbi:MAG: C25 family cysteine peptidase, partial [candidate division KSB1 bacterium]|nr:C25 family cysteine peptidase [candidate division KSB1 bacterium]
LANATIAEKWQSNDLATNRSQQESANWFQSGSTYYKLLVAQTGIHRLTFSYLANIGLPLSEIDPATFKIFNRGEEIPLLVKGQIDGRFDAEDFIEFYGQKNHPDSSNDDPYTDTNIYWLTWGNETGLRMNHRNSLNSALFEIDSYLERLHIEQDNDYYPGDNDYQIHNTELVPGEGWVWRFFFPGEKDTVVIPVSGLSNVSQSPRIKIKFKGTTIDPVRPNHHVKIFFNNEAIGDFYFTGTDTYIFETAVPRLINGENELMIMSAGDTGAKIDQFYLDWIDLEYLRDFSAINDQLHFDIPNQNSINRFSVWGFTDPHIRLFDLSTLSIIDSLDVRPGKKVNFEVTSAGFIDGNMALIVINSRPAVAGGFRGHNLAVVEESTGELLEIAHFDTYESSAEAERMARYIHDLPLGRIVLVAIKDEGSAKMTEAAYQALESLGSRLIRNVGMRDSWAMIGKKGGAIGSAVEQLTPAGSGKALVQQELVLPGSGQDFYAIAGDQIDTRRQYLVVSDHALLQPSAALLDTSADLRNANNGADLIIITHAAFRQEAERLGQYRASHNGLRVKVVDVQDIYDEFNYGIFDPRAIREFLKHAYSAWQTPAPSYVMLFGDASWDYKKNLGQTANENYVPSYGNPVSDNWFVCLDSEGDVLPDMVVGRIPVASPEQAALVVDKIIAYEHTPSSGWKKNMLFITGGFNRSEQNLFMNQTRSLIQQYVSPIPASCRPFQINKTTEGYFEGEKKNDVLSAIDLGMVWVNFLGHAGSRTWDLMFNHPDIEELTNQDRYPFITSMTCHTGRFAEPEGSAFGEHFLLAANKGAIGFWGTTGWGYIFQDNILLRNLFQHVLIDTIHVLGEATTLAKLKLWASYGFSSYNTNVIHQYTLLGDPLLNLALPEKPDLTIETKDVSFQPTAPAEADSVLAIRVTIQNWGLATNDSVEIRIFDQKGNESIPIFSSIKRPPIGLEDSTTVFWKLKDQAGEHLLRFIVDPENLIAEADEDNNDSEVPFYVYSSKISVSRPFDCQIIAPENVVLQVNNPGSRSKIDHPMRFYHFELDTSQSFQSPLLITSPPIPEGTLVTRWKTPALADSTTYFWRCQVREGAEVSNWISSSFTTQAVAEEVIWQQRHPQQFKKNRYDHASSSAVGMQLEEKRFTFQVESAGHDDGNYARILMNGIPVAEQHRGHNLVAIDAANGQVIADRYFDTWASTNQADSMADFIRGLENGNYVLAAIRDDGSLHMTEKAYLALESIGSQFCRQVRFRDSWAIVGIKGAAIGSVAEQLTPATQGIATVRDTLINYASQGTITSVAIGPASRWNFIAWEQDISAGGTKIAVDVLGFNKQLTQWETLLSGLSNFKHEDLSAIDAQSHPLIQLRAKLANADGRHTPTLRNWAASFVPVSDPAIGAEVISLNADSLVENDRLELTAQVYNVGMKVADSVKIRCSLITPNRGRIPLGDDQVLTQVPVDSFRTVHYNWLLNGFSGNQQFIIELDPGDQLNELSEMNNYVSAALAILPDTSRPKIIVNYDGKAIVPGDFVASQPLILIQIYDDGPIVAMDTSRYALFLDQQRLAFSGNEQRLFWVPIADPQNSTLRAQWQYRPELADGEHTLEVFAKDRRNNLAYHRDEFQVASEFNILNLFNYPNPFSRDTEFTFHLTQPADRVTIKIYTVSGKLLRGLDYYHLEAGFHRLYWNGLDQDRDEMANGVYLYKVTARSGNKQIERIEKLVIMR